MFEFLRRLWNLARPYRARLLLGVLAGVLGGVIEPVMIANITFVYSLIFPSTDGLSLGVQVAGAPAFLREWVLAVQQALSTGLQSHPGAVLVLVATIPAILFLRGFFSYCNIYFLHWAAIRTITDLRIRLFEHLMNLSAGFFSRAGTGELMSRISSDTLQL